jgi:hypothetical protein
MEDKEKQNNIDKSLAAGKDFMTIGPTLHYSHSNVLVFWLLSLFVFGLCCSFWSKITTGSFLSLNIDSLNFLQNLYLGQLVTKGVSIFEYPWQILVLGLLMGILAVAPVLTSQLMAFSYSLPFILLIAFFANLPLFALFVLISCLAAATRPLRFRSRFTAIALCLVPQLLYWGLFGGDKGAEPIVWGFSFTPWICAWLAGLIIAGLVIGIGHFTRYKPGLVFVATCLILAAAVIVFRDKIGFDELDYQLYIVKNSPEQVKQRHSITKALDDTLTNKQVIDDIVKAYFLPTEPILLRNRLKQGIIDELNRDRWPWWFAVEPELNYQDKMDQLLQQYDKFIQRRAKSKRMPIALYYKAILMELAPDLKHLEQTEELDFYDDYPGERASGIWHRLYRDFPNSPESLDARWRIAMQWVGLGQFSLADSLLEEALKMLPKKMELVSGQQTQGENLFSTFRPPPQTVITTSRLDELNIRINLLRILISSANHTDSPQSQQRLERFVILNPHDTDYPQQLAELLAQMSDKDPLKDNVLLEQTKLIPDEQLRAEKLAQLNKKYLNTDGGMQALYELSLLKRKFWSQLDSNSDQKKKLLEDARQTMTTFLSLYPDSIFCEQIKKILSNLPKAD